MKKPKVGLKAFQGKKVVMLRRDGDDALEIEFEDKSILRITAGYESLLLQAVIATEVDIDIEEI